MSLGGLFDLPEKEKRIAELDEKMLDPSFWTDQEQAQSVIAEVNGLKYKVNKCNELESRFEDLQIMYELAEEEQDTDMIQEGVQGIEALKEDMNQFELELLLKEQYDQNNALLELHPGAGGTESQDWAEMLLRMYTRWAEDQGFSVETLDYLPGEEAGVKSVTLLIKGHNAYGYLKTEKGVHRLVRLSPFDSSGRRHTSFASCHVMPELNDDLDLDIRMEDVRIDTYRSSGAGGQHVNTTDSAVRLTHEPTGVVVTCQSERSQMKNKEQAMKILKGRIYEKQLEDQKQELDQIKGEQKEIGWGSQIRSYVFHPYSMVKDHRTDVEIGNVQAVMDGKLTVFIDAYLRLQMKNA